MNIKKILPALASMTLVVGLSACAFDSPTITDAPPSTDITFESPSAPEGVGKFGQVVKWDGVDLTVSKPKAFEPSDTAGGTEKFEHNVSMDVKLTNTGEEPLDPTLVSVSASSAEEEAGAVFDVEKKIESGPTTNILPGKSVTWTVAFNVADPKDLVVEVSPPDFMMEPVLFSTGG